MGICSEEKTRTLDW